MCNSMSDWDIFANLLENKIPFAFSKFNDGEISLIRTTNSVASRGFQPNHPTLSEKLRDALCHIQKNYFVGIPCSICYPELRNYCNNIMKNKTTTLANVLINSNIHKTYTLLKGVSRVVYICSENANTYNLPFKPYFIYKVPNTDAWSKYNYVKTLILSFCKDDVVILACGPLGRVLVYEWFTERPDITFIELGSFYDPITTNKSYLYHEGILPYCSECNPVLLDTLPFEIEKCTHRELIAYQEWNVYSTMFRKHFPSLYRIYNRHLSDDTDRNYYCYICIVRTMPLENVFEKTLEISKKYPDRVEHVLEAISRLQNNEDKMILYKNIIDLEVPSGKNVQNYLYEWKILDDFVIFAYYAKKYEESYEAWQKLIRKNSFPESQRERIIDNGRYAKLYIDDKYSYDTFLKELENHPAVNEIHHKVPKYFHFIYISGKINFTLTHYLSIKTCFNIQKPDKIFLYNNKEPENNEWWEKAKDYVTIIKITIPCYINKQGVHFKQHQADIMRINILNKIGGVYMDLDVLSQFPIDGTIKKPKYENNGPENMYDAHTVIARETDNKLCNCVIVARKDNIFLKEWIKQYETKYGDVEDWWGGLSVITPNKLAENNKDVSILETKEFLPFLYNDFEFFTKDISEKVNNSFCIHLWETEANKRKLLPETTEYFLTNDNTLTKLFSKYL